MIDYSYTVAGALTGFVVGMTGVGGGALMTPILLLFFGVSPTTAVATDLWFAAITKTAGAKIHNRAGNVDWQVAKRLWTGSLPVAVIVIITVVVGTRTTKIDWLTNAIGIVILITAVGLIASPKMAKAAYNRRINRPDKFLAVQPILTVAGGAILGICVALTSVGAGALGSVMLLYLYPLRMHPHRLVATDIVHAIPLALISGTGYLFAGMVDGWMLLSLLLGSIPAVLLGSALVSKISGKWVRALLALVLLTSAIKILL